MRFKLENDFIIDLLRDNSPDYSDVQTDVLIYLLKYHRLSGFAYKLFLSKGLFPEDNELYKLLSASHREHMILRAALKGELIRFSELLESKGIPFLVIKGFSLANTIYSDSQQRHFADIDIIVPPGDLKAVEELLYTDGYQLIEGFHSKFEIEDCSRLGISRPYINSRIRSLQIDLHPTISIGPGFKYADIDDLWSEFEVFSFNGKDSKTLNKSLYLVYLCWHSIKHSVSRLVWFRDIHFFLKKYDTVFSDDHLAGYIEKYRTRRIVCTALKLTSTIFEDKTLSEKANELIGGQFSINNRYFNLGTLLLPRSDLSGITRIRRDISLIAGIKEKLLYLFRALLPHPDYIAEMPERVTSRWSIHYFLNRVKFTRK